MNVCLCVVALAAACLSGAVDSAASQWAASGPIAFQSRRDGAREVYTIAPDGSGLARITKHPSHDAYPSWSPDGSRFVLTSERVGWWKIWVMNADGSHVRQLTNSSSWDSYPRWSPDGHRVVFASERDGNAEIYVMNEQQGSGIPRQVNASRDFGATTGPALSSRQLIPG